jgi:hypothetical protein
MSTLDQLIESLIHEQDKIIKMGIIKEPNENALDMHDINNTSNSKSKQKIKGKLHANPNKEGYSKPFDDSSGYKGGKGKKGKSKCGYCNHDYHLELACMKKWIDMLVYILQNNNLRDHILEATKKKSKDKALAKGGNSHALIVINSYLDAWILYSRESHHMETTKNVLYSIFACMGPPILMGYDTPVEVIGQGRVELQHIIF